ncbi:Uncharacterised protein [Vibrio cholerae]|nr:Uncharacterised protein [Vibrio cholerae]CSI29189.1 Uncharacterised protein [Vibrio cholerae]
MLLHTRILNALTCHYSVSLPILAPEKRRC